MASVKHTDYARLLRRIGWPLGAALAAAVAWIAVSPRSPQSSSTTELQALVDAAGQMRLMEPRLSNGFAYGPLSARRGSVPPDAVSPAIRLAAVRAEKAFTQRATPDTQRALGVAYLVTGQVDKAITMLERTAIQVPKDARLFSDLAAAYLVRGKDGRLEDVAKAVSRAERAIAVDSSLPEAFFNRALGLEALFLQRAARESWEKYLQLDGRSPWADEGRMRLQMLSAQPESPWKEHATLFADPTNCKDRKRVQGAVDGFVLRTREILEDELLPSWADAYINGSRVNATGWLDCASTVAEALALNGDLLARDSVSAIKRAAARARVLAKGHQAFREGRRLADESRFAEAEKRFQSAAADLQRGGSAFWIGAAYHAANSAYYQQRYQEVVPTLTRLAKVAELRQYHAVAGRVHRLRGVIEVSESRLAAALDDYRSAASYFERIRDFESAVALETLMAENLQLLGEPRESWDHLARALASLSTVSTPLRRYQVLWTAIQKCMHDRLPEVALHFQDAFLENASAWPNAGSLGAVTSGYVQRSRVLQRLGHLESASDDLRKAKRFLAEVRDPGLAERWETEILLAEGEVFESSNPTRAVNVLTDAIARLESSRGTGRLPQVFLRRGRAQLTLGNVDGAAVDFEHGIRVFEEQHDAVSGARLRISHFDESWDLFTDMIRLQLQRRNQPDVALSFVERGRARTLLESVNRGGTAVKHAGDVALLQRRLPPGVAVLSFVTLPDSMATWVITNRSATVSEQSLDMRSLEMKIEGARAALVESSAQHNELLTELHDLLLAPFIDSIRSDTAVVIVPDGPLHAVPFGALIDRRSNRYFVEDHAFGIAPSLATFVEMSERIRELSPQAAARMLVVGNPAIDRASHSNLPDLAGAQREAIEIAGLYPGAELLLETRATRARFLESLGRNDVVHFAGHAVANAEYPWLSRLLFAPEGGPGSDTLFAHEIGEQTFNRLQLVVLAACSTGAGTGVRGEGALSLARAFLATGAPTVIGSLWDVSDSMSQRLFGEFYRRLRGGAAPLHALRDAQRAALRSEDAAERQPVNWAGFAAYGGFVFEEGGSR